MIEIDEVMPLYLEDGDDTAHVSNPLYAKHQAMVLLFEQFNKYFYTYVDDYNRLVCVERKGIK